MVALLYCIILHHIILYYTIFVRQTAPTPHPYKEQAGRVGGQRVTLLCPKDSALTLIKLLLSCEEFDYLGICLTSNILF